MPPGGNSRHTTCTTPPKFVAGFAPQKKKPAFTILMAKCKFG